MGEAQVIAEETPASPSPARWYPEGEHGQEKKGAAAHYGLLLLYAMATIHVVWFYLCHTRCYIQLARYEQGMERTPFQYRILLMLPLRWAHSSPALNRWAHALTALHSWFPTGVRPEGLLEAAVDIVSVTVAGLVARSLYRLASPTRLLSAFVYPLTLVMVLSTYALINIHPFRFIYDLPSLAFFSAGLLAIYRKPRSPWWMLIFLLGTVNRETTLFLLVLFALGECARAQPFSLRRLYAPATLARVLPLAAFWVGWHLWLVHHFRANPSAAAWRVGLNLELLLIPVAWPQLLCLFGYALPLVLPRAARIADPVLRCWLWVLPAWFLFMLYYGVFVELRIFGELIPFVACAAALVAEDSLLARAAQMSAGRALASVGAHRLHLGYEGSAALTVPEDGSR